MVIFIEITILNSFAILEKESRSKYPIETTKIKYNFKNKKPKTHKITQKYKSTAQCQKC